MTDSRFDGSGSGGAPQGSQAICGFVASWAALGVVLSGGTQLRMPGLPIGPSEIFLVAWMLFVGFLLLRGVNLTSGPALRGLATYWALALMLLAFGALVALETGNLNPDLASHDAFAFVYASVLTGFLSMGLGGGQADGYHLHMARTMFLLTGLAAAVLLGMSSITAQLGPINFWYYGVRFRGWAENPNQMALAVVAMPFLGWYLLKQVQGFARRAAYALAIACCVAAGLATGSDAVRVSWAVTLGCLACLLWYRIVLRGRGRWLYLSHILVPALIAVVGAFNAGGFAAFVGDVVQRLYEEGDQGSLRVTLWTNALQAIGESLLVGFGPGRFSGVEGPFLRYEAHNTLLDWGMSAGFLGILLHVALWTWCAWRAVKSGSLELFGVVVSIIMFAQFHYSLRQPVYWMMFVLVLTLAERRVVSGAPAAMATAGRMPLTRPAN